MMSGAKKRVPKRRFKEFLNAGDWEQRKLGSIGSTYTGLSGKTKEDFGHGEAKYITYLNVFQNTISNITMTDKVEIDPTQNEVKYGDVLFTTSSETPEEVGMSSVWLGDTPNIYLNSFCFGFRPNQKIDSYFLGYSLRAPYMRDKIKILAQGISRYNISKNKVMELEISLPNNEEQKLLGTFLQRIDLIITLHQRKLDKLQATKKALLQEMFPEEGQDKPKRRFKGFTDAWEQRKLGDVADVRDGTHDSPKFYNDGFPLVTSKNLKDGSIDFSDCSFISEQDFDEINKRSKVDPGDILFGMIGTIGKPAIVEYTGFAIKNVALIKEGNIINNRFIYHLLSSKVFDNYIARENAGGTQKFIALNQIRNFIFSAPTLAEQNKIIELLDYISQIITLHQRKLDKLKNLKQAYLNEMFV